MANWAFFFLILTFSHSEFILNSYSPNGCKLSALVYSLLAGDTCFGQALPFTLRSKYLNLKVFEENIYLLSQYSLF